MGDDLHVLFERIRGLLDEPQSESRLGELEHTLTDGYARALVLEGERVHIERSIAELAHRIDGEILMAELRELSERRTAVDADLARLRALLELLRRRLAEERAAVSS